MRLISSMTVIGVISLLGCRMTAQTIGAKDSKKKPAQTVLKCGKTDEKIVIDGKLDEAIWRRTPSVKFTGITDGSEPPFPTEGKMTWDDDYLYVGFNFARPDVRCNWTMRDAHLTDAEKTAFLGKKFHKGPWAHGECAIMTLDSFAKVFLDPDGDGGNYVEFHVNPGNNVFDAWYEQGFSNDQWGDRNRFPHVEWDCPGLITATRIDGTVNASHDVDKGWSIEMAIPWKALAPFTQGACPPKDGDVWGGHLGRVYRDEIGGKNQYWVWPFLEYKNCHLPDRYAKVVFVNDLDEKNARSKTTRPEESDPRTVTREPTAKFTRVFGWSPRPEEEFMKRAVEIGVTDMIGNPSKEMLQLCDENGVKFYAKVILTAKSWKDVFPDEDVPMQQTTPEGTSRKPADGAKTPAKHPENWLVTKRQKKTLSRLNVHNRQIQNDFQWGGEPRKKHSSKQYNDEVLGYDVLCFHDPRTLAAVKAKIKQLMTDYPGVAGIAFDGIGYRNYHDCHCPASLKLYETYCEENKIEPSPEAWREFSLKTLVDFNNTLVDYVKELNPEAKTTNHIWPVYLPEPLYGNRLKIDFCQQTAAWFFPWDPLKIERYSRVITADQNKYWPNVKGVAFLGYYDPMKYGLNFPYKSPERIECELRAILKGGSRMLGCGLPDVLDDPEVTAVVAKFTKKENNEFVGSKK